MQTVDDCSSLFLDFLPAARDTFIFLFAKSMEAAPSTSKADVVVDMVAEINVVLANSTESDDDDEASNRLSEDGLISEGGIDGRDTYLE